MITFTKSYKTTDDQVFATIEEAQIHELKIVLHESEVITTDGFLDIVAEILLKNKDTIIDILTTAPNSKPKARAIHGGTKKRKTVVTDAKTDANTLMAAPHND